MSDVLSLAECCAFHPAVSTLRACTRCDKPACPDCLVDAAVGSHCVEWVGTATKQARRLARADVDKRQLFRPGLAFGLLVAVFGVFAVLTARTPVSDLLGPAAMRIGPIVLLFAGWVISLCFHEYAHALAACLGGDRSVVEKGYLTLDPRRYAHPLLTFGLPIAFLLLGGIGLPGGAVYIEHDRLRSRRWETIVSLAGPAANVLFGAAILGVVSSGVADSMPSLAATLTFLGAINLYFLLAYSALGQGFIDLSVVGAEAMGVPGELVGTGAAGSTVTLPGTTLE